MKKLALVALLIASSSFAEQNTPSSDAKASVLKTVVSAVTSKYGKITGGVFAAAAAVSGAWVAYTKYQEKQAKN